jgi:TonB family protein
MHRVPFGAVENLNELIASVRENRHFAMDFWALVGDLSSRERGSLSDEETLDVIVEAVTGSGVAAVASVEAPKVEELKQLLAGVDVARPAELPDPIAEPDDALLSSHIGGPKRIPNRRQSAPVVVLPDRNGATKVEGLVRPATVTEDAWVARHSIGEALSRLERTSTELREQLAAIDEQLIQQGIKPAADAREKAQHTAAIEQEASAHEAPKLSQHTRQPQIPEAADWRRKAAPITPADRQREAKIETARQILREWNETHRGSEVPAPGSAHTLSHRGLARSADDDEPGIPVSFSGYADENESRAGRRLAIAAAVLVLLAGGGFLFSRTNAGQATLERIRPALQTQYEQFASRVSVLKREATPKQETPSSSEDTPSPNNEKASAPQAPASSSPAPTKPPTNPPTNQPANQSINRASQTESHAPEAANAGISQPPQPGTASQVAPTGPTSRRDSDRTRSSEIPPEPTGAMMVDDAATVKVPPAVMEANLVASRVPAYPEYAKAEGIEGPVVMEAIISKDGNVDHVRVIEGERHLRSAAEDAVLKWRYRPYMVNGRPVDVATVVRVDFRLNGASHY